MKEKKQAMNEKDLENVSGGLEISASTFQGGLNQTSVNGAINLENVTANLNSELKDTPTFATDILNNKDLKSAVRIE